MAKIENTKMTVSLDNDSKRIVRNLTKAIDRLARNVVPSEVEDGVTRLMEPADDPALSDDNDDHSPGEKPSFASGGYVPAATVTQPGKGCYNPEKRAALDARALNELQAVVGKYNALR